MCWKWLLIDAAAHLNLQVAILVSPSSVKHPMLRWVNIWQLAWPGSFTAGSEMWWRVGRWRTDALLLANWVQKDVYFWNSDLSDTVSIAFEYFLAYLHSFTASLSILTRISLCCPHCWPLRLLLLPMNVTVFIVHHWAKVLQSVAIAWAWINGSESIIALKSKSESRYFKPATCGRTELVTCEMQWSAKGQGQNDNVQVKCIMLWWLVIEQNQVHGAL